MEELEDLQYTNTKADFHATKFPIKNQIKTIEDAIDATRSELVSSAKSYKDLRSDMSILDYNSKEALNCCLSNCMDIIKKHNDTLLKIVQENECASS